jgi:hypothetical protein
MGENLSLAIRMDLDVEDLDARSKKSAATGQSGSGRREKRRS